MIEDTDLYNTRRAGSEKTEDGDRYFSFEVRAKGFAGVRAFHAAADRFIRDWTACGDGWLKGTYGILVDGAEIAIEARNDEWASRQQEIEDHALGYWR
jgi:hypothetical protein